MSKRRDVMLAIKALVGAALPTADIRGFDGDTAKPQSIGEGGAIVGHPGDPGEPDVDLNPLVYHFEHGFVLEVAPSLAAADPDAALDTMLSAIGAAVEADRFLSGLCDFLDVQGASLDDQPLDGSISIRWAEITIVASYAASNPLGN